MLPNLLKKFQKETLDFLNIPENKKFDYIFSYSSCGVHYPLETYKELILKHSHKNTVCIFDLRKHTLPKLRNKIQIIHNYIIASFLIS